ncbi:MAG: hypothetical protein JKY37_09610 [Nannocystaceae bacterium]|nr:hypothetical protein [Nannocystaceae bacterium]
MTKNAIVGKLVGVLCAASLWMAPGCDGADADKSGGDAKAAVGGAKAAAEGKQADDGDPVPAKKLPEAEALLAKAVEAAGGTAAFAKFKSFYYEGEVVIAGQKLEASAQLWWKEGNFYTQQDMGGVGRVMAGKDGDKIWSQDPINGLRQLEGLEAEQVAWLSSLMLASDWKRYFTSAETTKEIQDGDTTLYVVKLTSESGGEIELHLDKNSGMQTGLAFSQATPMGNIPITLKMQDYRDFEGVKLAYKQVTEMPLAVATLEIKALKLNPEISDARFQMPTAGADVVTKPAAK